MEESSNHEQLLDLSEARRFFSEAIKIAHEYGKAENKNNYYTDLKEVDVADGINLGISLYEDLPDVAFNKFFARQGTVFNKEVCKGYHKVIIISEGEFFINIGDGKRIINLPKDRKFCYLMDGNAFNVEFLEDTWFYVVSIPS